MRLADGNKPIKVGDKSYIYKGVYNPIYWIGDKPYRPRVETLVIKDGTHVYMNIDDDIELSPPDLRYKKYSLPGGSLDADSTKIEQAEAETNEEALVKVSLLYHTGYMYYELYKPGFIARGGDTPLEYYGSISDVYLGVYDGEYDKSKVEEKDLDPKMAEHGGFHEILSIAKFLRKEHINALIDSQFVNEEVRIKLRLLRTDVINESTSPIIVPDRYIYHGSVYEIDEFKPMSLDLGNLYDEPGWSTFCFGDYNYARVFGFMKALIKEYPTSQVVFDKGVIKITRETYEKYLEKNIIDDTFRFYVYTIDSKDLNLGIGNDPTLKEYTFRESGIKPVETETFDLSMRNLGEFIEIEDGKISRTEDSDYKVLQIHDYNKEKEVRDKLYIAINKGDLKPGDDIVKYMEDNGISFKSDDIRIPDIGLDIDEPVLETINIDNFLLETKFPIDCYGLPERKAYPMPDKKHVKSAIKFFNYAKKDEEKELANKINEKIREFGMKDINVGENNRFKKYYKPIVESYTLEDYLNAMTQTYSKLEKCKTPKEKITVSNQLTSIIRMMVSNSDFLELDEDTINKSYATLAEISQNQLEYLAELNPEPITESRSIMYVLEADDEEETEENNEDEDATAIDTNDNEDTEDDTEEEDTATDYTAMADEEGEEPTEEEEPTDGEEGEEPTEGGDEEATDYDEMADGMDDEGGEEGEATDDTEGEEPTDDGTDDTTEEDNTEEEINKNSKQYNNKELKN